MSAAVVGFGEIQTEPQLPVLCSVWRSSTDMYTDSERRICTNVPWRISSSTTSLGTSPSGTPESNKTTPTSSNSSSAMASVALVSGTECATTTSELVQAAIHQLPTNNKARRRILSPS